MLNDELLSFKHNFYTLKGLHSLSDHLDSVKYEICSLLNFLILTQVQASSRQLLQVVPDSRQQRLVVSGCSQQLQVVTPRQLLRAVSGPCE